MLHVLQAIPFAREVWFARLMCCVSRSSSTALCPLNAHITLYDVTTWSWANLVHPETIARGKLVLQAPIATVVIFFHRSPLLLYY